MKTCPICKKGTIIGGKRSNRVRATQYNPTVKHRKYPNLQWVHLPAGKAGLPSGSASRRRIKICTDCIKKGRHLTAKF